ncbi:glutathione S-transferase family protein [Loktanella sp. DJP18]|uniref:glutathione S-transferase family protein n=1 Tax=Loktanella sp. DJP18 TaxID=3409788 RepID=UPI003BB5A252
MIRLHHCPGTRSMRSLWLLHEIGVDFDLKVWPFDRTLRGPDYKALNPTGRVPALEMDGAVIVESGAIAEVLCERFSPEDLGRPAGHAERAKWLEWVHYAETISQHCANLTQQHVMLRDDTMRSPIIMQLEAKRLAITLRTVDAALTGRDWLLAGGFSAADIGVGQAVEMARRFVRLDELAHLSDWFARITARPAFRASLPEGAGLYDRDFYAPWTKPE